MLKSKKKMGDIKVGDKVEMIGDCSVSKGRLGIVKYFDGNNAGVEWEDFNGHELFWKNTIHSKSSHGWVVAIEDIKVIKYKTTTMKKLSNMMKKLLDSDTQTLVKAGYINGDLDLTGEGEDALIEILFDAQKAALVSKAASKVADEVAEANK